MEALRAEVLAVVREDPPMTVRQVYYQLVTRGVIEKTEAAVVGGVGDARRRPRSQETET